MQSGPLADVLKVYVCLMDGVYQGFPTFGLCRATVVALEMVKEPLYIVLLDARHCEKR
jgi:hypothetical protein